MSAPATVTTSTRMFLAFLAARFAFGLGFLVSAARKSPVPWYLPLERRFEISSRPAGLGMDWYGRTAFGLGVALAAGLAAYFLARRGRLAAWLASPSVVIAIARAGGLILLVDFVYFGWVLMHQTPRPWPIPSWYCPR